MLYVKIIVCQVLDVGVGIFKFKSVKWTWYSVSSIYRYYEKQNGC